MKRRCWFRDLPGAGACDGRLVRCHLVPRRVLRDELGLRDVAEPTLRRQQMLEPKPQRLNVWDERAWVWGCGGPTGIGGHHGMLDHSRTLRIPRHRLPVELEEFAAELGLGWWLEREYGPLLG